MCCLGSIRTGYAVYSALHALRLLNFDHYRDGWTVHFIQGDCRSHVGSRTRSFTFPALHDLRTFVTRCQPEDAILAEFDHNIRAWSRGSEYVLTVR